MNAATDADLRVAIDQRLAARIESARRRRAARERARVTKHARRTGRPEGAIPDQARTTGEAMNVSDELRRAIGRLNRPERTALVQQSRQAGQKWTGSRPGLAEVWNAFAELVEEIDRMERARFNATVEMPLDTMRAARKGPK